MAQSCYLRTFSIINPYSFRWRTPIVCVLAFIAGFASRSVFGQSEWQRAMKEVNSNIAGTFEVDDQKIQATGIRKVSGKHIDLYTDSPSSPEIDELVDVFDLCLDPWCDYFDIAKEKTANWRIRVFLIHDARDPSRFQRSGLLPADLPKFLAGFQRNHNIWIYHQPGKYYTRHLLIHEGTHAFMQWFLNGYGSPWYAEGIAELFGVHRWTKAGLQLRYRLRDRSEAEYWGRVKGIIDDRARGKSMTLTDVLNIPTQAFREVRYYSWSWAACEFFSNHESTQATMGELKKNVNLDATQFNQRFSAAIAKNWDRLERDWELFIGEIDYGYQIQRGRLSLALPGDSSKFEIRSEKSWQVTNVQVKRGDRIRISGTGEFLVGKSDSASGDEIPWPCQSNGITIEYHRGHPLGMLHAGILALDSKTAAGQVRGLLNPIPIGSEAEFIADSDGVLCLRINESPARLDDNEGGLEVIVEKLK